MREDMALRLVALLLAVTWTVAMAAGTEDLETFNIVIGKSLARFSAEWDWDDRCPRDVAFTALYERFGDPDSETQDCAATAQCSCEIPADLLDPSYNYTLLVFATTADGRKLNSSRDFDPNRETRPPPAFRVAASDALVMVKISTPDIYYIYKLILRLNGSTEETARAFRSGSYIIPPSGLLPGRTYCVRLREYNTLHEAEVTPYSPEQCFLAPANGPPNNLRMEALDATYILRWDWDFEQSPNVTFSVEKCHENECSKLKACGNITTARCNCSALDFNGEYILRVSVYDSRSRRKSSGVTPFKPFEDTILGPPKDLTLRIVQNELFVNVSAPEGFKHDDILNYCNWRTHLKYWTNSTLHSEVTVKEHDLPFFKIESLEASTTYCMKAKMKCWSSNRSSLYSGAYCQTTGPRSYLVQWVTPFAFLGIAMIAVALYLCFCPLKRYIQHIFFPSNTLPSSIEKGFGESPLDCINHPFLLHEEEILDRCHIVHNSNADDSGQVTYKSISQDSSQDSENSQTTEGTDPSPH